jgi:hypothetical protein
MPSPTNKDRDDAHRRRRQVGDSRPEFDGREAARRLYGFARESESEDNRDDDPTLFDD